MRTWSVYISGVAQVYMQEWVEAASAEEAAEIVRQTGTWVVDEVTTVFESEVTPDI